MRIGILGDLEVFDPEGRPVAVQGRNQRTLLGVLATRPGAVFSADALVDAIWDRRPPANATSAVQTVVSRLRSALGEGVVVTRPSGYLLQVAAGDVDAGRFEGLADEGRAALAAGDAAAAGALLRTAIALWRGSPLAECGDADVVRFEAGRLEECRLRALEDRIDADLAAGRHEEIAAEVEALAGEHRLRERLQEQRLLVLYRSGRPAEALARYREVARFLLEEHGLEPGRRLRELERRMLTQDAALEPAAAPRPLAAAPAPGPPPPAPATRSTRRLVTVLLVELDPAQAEADGEDAERELRAVRRLLDDAHSAVQRHGGLAETVAGDAVLATFGLAPAHEDDALRAVRAALELRADVTAVGVATGEVVASAGETVSGRVVSRARALARRAGAGGVLVDAETVALTRVEMTYEAVSTGEGPPAFRLAGSQAPEPAARPLGTATFVNRDDERGRLAAAYGEACATRRTRVAIVVGQAGIGKSRLVRELLTELGDAAVTAAGRCLPYGESTSAFALETVVRDLVGDDDLRAGLTRVLAGVERREQVVDRIATAVGATGQDAPSEEIQWAVRRLLERLAQERPVVIVVDDVHWAEPWLVDLVEYLAAFATGPILLVICARPELLEAVPAWAGPDGPGTVVSLEPLSAPHVRALVAALLRGHDAPAAIEDRIAARSGGSPLFAEQVVAFEAERGFGPDQALPHTLRTLLQARLDALAPREQEVLGRGAVEGLVFHRGALTALADADVASEHGAVIALMRRGFIAPAEPEVPGEDAFRFRHELLREAAYERLPKALRQTLHARFADWLERVEPDARPVIGHHLRQAWLYAGQLDGDEAREALGARGAGHLLAAAEASRARSALPAAATLLQQAAEMLPAAAAERPDALVELAGVLLTAGRLEAALATVAEAAEAARAAGRQAAGARAALLGVQVELQLDGGQAIRLFGRQASEAERVLTAQGDELGLSLLHNTRAQLEWFQGRCEAARVAWDVAAEHARRGGSQAALPELLTWIASALHLGSEPVDRAIPRCRQLVSETREHLVSQAFIRRPLALLHALDGDFAAAHAELDQSSALYAELGDTIQSAARNHEAEVAFLEGDLERSERVLRDSVDRLAAMGDRSFTAVVLLLLARTLEAQGRLADAQALTEEGAGLAAQEDAVAQVLHHTVLARILAARGQAGEALRLAEEACAIAAPTDWLVGQGDAAFAVGVAHTAAGTREEADRAFAEAFRAYARKGARSMTAGARGWLAQRGLPEPPTPRDDAIERIHA